MREGRDVMWILSEPVFYRDLIKPIIALSMYYIASLSLSPSSKERLKAILGICFKGGHLTQVHKEYSDGNHGLVAEGKQTPHDKVVSVF
jgi:hypothetical protein